MIKPLQLGNKIFPINLIQGPLAGISCAPFRLLTTRYGEPAYTCTEMISCKTLLHKPIKTQQRYIKKDPNEGPVCFQIAGNDTKEIALATKIASDMGADLIDLNCGCPVKKIRSKGCGSGLLTHPQQIYHLISSMKQNTHVPVAIKIRVEGASSDTFNAEIAKVVMEAGADFLIVHGRHWTEHYETPCNYEQIQFFVENVSIPVIGNGDVACIQTLKKMFATGCAGAMIGRAGVGQPWLIKQLVAEMQNQVFVAPSMLEIKDIFLEHVQRLISLLNNEKFSILQARTFAKYYTRKLSKRLEFCEKVNACENFSDLKTIADQYLF